MVEDKMQYEGTILKDGKPVHKGIFHVIRGFVLPLKQYGRYTEVTYDLRGVTFEDLCNPEPLKTFEVSKWGRCSFMGEAFGVSRDQAMDLFDSPDGGDGVLIDWDDSEVTEV